jgi:hypothetical protein
MSIKYIIVVSVDKKLIVLSVFGMIDRWLIFNTLARVYSILYYPYVRVCTMFKVDSLHLSFNRSLDRLYLEDSVYYILTFNLFL